VSKILAIIPARGGSKTIPRKNLRLLHGKPLIAHSIGTALKSRSIDRVTVSTEDHEIAEISKKYGAEVIERPEELARDDSPTIGAVLHALDFLEKQGYMPDVVVLLEPTSPLRNVEDIDNAIQLLLNSDCESIVSVCEVGHSPYWMHEIKDGYLKPLFDKKYVEMMRQDLPKIYMPNGAVCVSTPGNLRRFRSFYTNKILPCVMPIERSVDIDTEMDLELAEAILNGGRRARS
jgi:CMP-N,N'-diacetyllegionaminic acid synthase